MSHKRLRFHSEAREKVLHGAQALADAEENLGVQVLRQAAERTADVVGDGTTTSTLIACALFADGVRNIAAGASAVDIKRGLERAVRAAVAALATQSRSVTTRLEKVQVATVSAHNDLGIGEIVADAIDRVGAEGGVTVEEAKGTETSLEVVEGMQFDRGFLSSYFVTDSSAMEAVAGLAFLRMIDAVHREAGDSCGDELTGVLMLARALEVPTRQIAANSGADGGVVVERMRIGTGARGFDAARGEYVDLLEHGIVDATKVVRLALEHAVSVAGTLLLTEATLTEIPARSEEAAASAV